MDRAEREAAHGEGLAVAAGQGVPNAPAALFCGVFVPAMTAGRLGG